MRATTIFTCLLLALGAPAAADELTVGDPPECITLETVKEYVTKARPGFKPMVYRGVEAAAIKANIASFGPLSGERVFAVFSNPDYDRVLIIGFFGGCREAHEWVSRRTLNEWLAGQKAGQ